MHASDNIGQFLDNISCFHCVCESDLKQQEGMAVVTQCPTNALEKFFASLRLGCGSDIYGNDQYICAPNEAKTSLVELCNEGIMGIIDEGLCLVVKGTSYMTKSCRAFYKGCPTEHYWSSNFYNNSACQKIDTQRQCYVMDLFCQDQMSGEDGVNSILIILGVGFAAVVLIIVVCIYLCICKRSRKSAKEMEKLGGGDVMFDTEIEKLGSGDVMSNTEEDETRL